MSWNFDIDAAPRDGSPIWAFTAKGEVIRSFYLPPRGREKARWVNLATGQEPVAWQLFVRPEPPVTGRAQHGGYVPIIEDV
jgi:hypothetical protein